MADNASNISFRESGLYIGPEIEGYLEKKGTGLVVRKTKTWCSLQGSTLYLKKSQGLMDTLDIGEAHQVKKSGNDATVFEITIKKKSHVFICPNAEECSKWVKALHTAMARKDSCQRGSNFFLPSPGDASENVNSDYESVYNTIPGEQPEVKDCNSEQTIYNVSLEYSDPIDSKETTQRGSDPLYSDINDVNIPVTSKAKGETLKDINRPDTSNTEDLEQETYTDGYSTVQKCKQTQENSNKQKLSVTGNSNRTQEMPEEIYNEASSTNDAGQLADDPSFHEPQLRLSFVQNKTTQETTDDKDKEVTVDPFSMLKAALTEDDTPIPTYNHPLTQADREPLNQLKDCLSSHPRLCDVSHVTPATNDNPISSLKAYLKTLNI